MPPGLTTRWFGVAFDNENIWEALRLSVSVALVATLFALVLRAWPPPRGRYRFFRRRTVSFFVMALPLTLLASSPAHRHPSAINLAGVPFSFWTIVVGHATFCVVVVYNNVPGRLRQTAGSVVEASPGPRRLAGVQTLRHVLLPTVGTALLAGGMLAFALSFDEIIVTTFTAGTQETLPSGSSRACSGPGTGPSPTSSRSW